MNHKHIAILLAVVVGTGVAGIGLVSAGHDPTDDQSNVYIHVVNEIHQGPDAQICVEDMEGNVNKIIVEGETTHLDTTIYHEGEDGDMVLQIPELNTPAGHKIVVFTNEQNGAIESLQGTCTPPGVDVTERVVLGAYYLATGHIELTQGVEVTTGPNVADDAPAPGSGSFSGISSVSSDEDSTVPDTNGTDDVLDPDRDTAPGDVTTDPIANETNGTVDYIRNETDGQIDETEDEVTTIVEHLQRTVDETVNSVLGSESDGSDGSDAPTDAADTADGGPLTGAAFGLTGFLGLVGLLFGFIRHWSS